MASGITRDAMGVCGMSGNQLNGQTAHFRFMLELSDIRSEIVGHRSVYECKGKGQVAHKQAGPRRGEAFIAAAHWCCCVSTHTETHNVDRFAFGIDRFDWPRICALLLRLSSDFSDFPPT